MVKLWTNHYIASPVTNMGQLAHNTHTVLYNPYIPGRETQNHWDYRCLYLVFMYMNIGRENLYMWHIDDETHLHTPDLQTVKLYTHEPTVGKRFNNVYVHIDLTHFCITNNYCQ